MFKAPGRTVGDVARTNSTAPLAHKPRQDQRQAPASSQPSVHHQQITDGIEILQQYVQTIWETPCHKCNANITNKIDIKATIYKWFGDSGNADGHASLCVRRCDKCHALTCLGCGEAPLKCEPRKINGHYISWCCLDGRIITLWMFLCRFDMTEMELRALSQQSTQSQHGRKSTNTSSGISGVGYAAPNPWLMMAGDSWARNQDMPIMKLKQENPEVENFFKWIMDIVAFALPDSRAKNIPPVLPVMLELSLVIDKAAEILRNDSLDNIMERSEVYSSVLNLVEKIGAHQGLLRLVQEDRFSKTRSSGLQNISFSMDSNSATKVSQELIVLANGSKDQSLAKRLENLAIQSELVLGVHNSEAGLKGMCQQISSVYKSIKKEQPDSAAKLPKEQWSDFHKANSLTFNDVILADFHAQLRIESGQIERRLQYSRTITSRNKRILSECANMRTSLDDGTFVIVAESRPDMMRALMVGPEDTPYGNGLFEFEILLPADYPRSPPKIYIKITRPIMININLHPDGKVCLSLLGTHFAGDTIENWQPGISTILQCLLSIRAMILISDSLSQNAPIDMGISRMETASFDRSVQAQTIWFFMLNWLLEAGKCNGVWKAVIQKHFSMRREEILRTVKGWTQHNPDLRSWNGHLAFVASVGHRMEYVPGFHGHRSIDLLEYLEKNLHTLKSGA